MMSPDELLSWYQRLDVSQAARAEINRIRSAASCRRVGGGRSDVIGRYPSRKMGVAIQFESHHVELAFVREMEQIRKYSSFTIGHLQFRSTTKVPKGGALG
jgi:putative transposase